ncbi:hypothetical protein CK218_12725 [Mesorhizobium sp. WSM3879]|nr:hypothetical protein CK218_12725 [Mesorhizobium sp. WSM3879]
MGRKLPIKEATWARLTECNRAAVEEGWASPGVFATGIGPEYDPKGDLGLLYVGKSAGPLGTLVGSGSDQIASGSASTRWMVEKRNKSAFWQMVDLLDPSRRRIAWTNICKMDEVGGNRPPPMHRWQAISEPHRQALIEEIKCLSPRVIIFATSGYCGDTVSEVLEELGYGSQLLNFRDGYTRLTATPGGAFAIETRHPQGWPKPERNRVVGLARKLLHQA